LTEARKLQEQLTFRAENDFLTNLPNRALFYDRLETAMARSRRSRNLMALLYMDIDHFKEINDTLGHMIGDDVLRQFSRRLSQSVRASDTAARLGGDEFTLILENLSSPEAAEAVVAKIMAALRQPYDMGGKDMPANASMGIAFFNGDAGIVADELIKQADTALYQAKHRGRDNTCVYDGEGACVPCAPAASPPGNVSPQRNKAGRRPAYGR
jgi:diguanylate cyclase (GGDEF)-like protein